MRCKISSIIALICILVYIAAIGFAVYRAYISIAERMGLAEREFYLVTDIASSTDASKFMDEAFQELIRRSIQNSQTLEAIIISDSYGREHVFERESKSSVTWVDGAPRIKTRFGITRNRGVPLRIDGLRNVTIRGASNYIAYDEFIVILKYTLFAVLVALAIAFFTLILELASVKNKPAGVSPGPSLREPAPDNLDEGLFDVPGGGIPGEAGEEAAFDDDDDDDEPAIKTAAEPQPLSAGQVPSGGPQGLYSPRGNISWEAYVKDRLTSELHRCASFDQDLVFIVMECKDTVELDDEAYKQFSEIAVRFFILRDLVFERGERGVSVIIPNLDLEQGFSKCEEFHSRILSAMPFSFKRNGDLCIGLSSRSGRLIDADRIAMEASQALEKAVADPASSIVAFKSDPEKYRAFIASQKKRIP